MSSPKRFPQRRQSKRRLRIRNRSSSHISPPQAAQYPRSLPRSALCPMELGQNSTQIVCPHSLHIIFPLFEKIEQLFFLDYTPSFPLCQYPNRHFTKNSVGSNTTRSKSPSPIEKFLRRFFQKAPPPRRSALRARRRTHFQSEFFIPSN